VPGLVLDASVALAWMLPGEVDAAQAGRLIGAVAEAGAIVPGHWRLEVANTLLMAEQRGRVAPEGVAALLSRLAALPITTDPETAARAWDTCPDLVRRHRLSLYDAAYLELARRQGLPLASFDGALLRAAEAEGVAVAGRGELP
jgi:predicted nucleic acid-binding protein